MINIDRAFTAVSHRAPDLLRTVEVVIVRNMTEEIRVFRVFAHAYLKVKYMIFFLDLFVNLQVETYPFAV